MGPCLFDGQDGRIAVEFELDIHGEKYTRRGAVGGQEELVDPIEGRPKFVSLGCGQDRLVRRDERRVVKKDDRAIGRIVVVEELVRRDAWIGLYHGFLTLLYVDVERRIGARGVEGVGGQRHTVGRFVREAVVNEQCHSNRTMIDAAIFALFKGAEKPDAGPYFSDGSEDGSIGIAGLTTVRGIETRSREAFQIFGVGARTKAHPCFGVVAIQFVEQG